jgi:hypothetical protein
VVAAATLAFGAGSPALGAVGVVSAANHCTNYFPTSYSPDSNCNTSGGGTNGSIPANTWGGTGSTALRDNNCMYTTAMRGLEVWYGDNTPSYSFSNNICGGSSVGYQYSECALSDPSSATGRCVTIWHD